MNFIWASISIKDRILSCFSKYKRVKKDELPIPI